MITDLRALFTVVPWARMLLLKNNIHAQRFTCLAYKMIFKAAGLFKAGSLFSLSFSLQTYLNVTQLPI